MTPRIGFSYRSIRGKLTLAAVTPLVVILLLVTLAASYLINESIVNQAQKQIRNDLNAARVILSLEQQRVQDLVRFSARSSELISLLANYQQQDLTDRLADIQQREKLDLLSLTNRHGLPLLAPQKPEMASLQPSDRLPFIQKALKQEQFSGIVLLDEATLRRESSLLAERAQIFGTQQALVPLERRGMFLLSATRISDDEGKVLGCLYGGILLNNNLPLIDRINQLVYSNDRFDGTEVGSATIFLGKLRVATTVRLKNGERALGTQVSQEVADAVLLQGESWLARALVVNEWYLTAYEPIFADNGDSIGALYVGMLEKPFTSLKKRSFLILFGLLIFGCLFGGFLAQLLARRLTRPVLDLADSAEKIAHGQREVELPIAGQDEIGHLTTAFADMASALKQSDDERQNLNRQLEEKVAQRTSQLEEKSLQLIETQEQLLRQEKLAAIGSLATGVAHEINNPAAIIRGNVEILQMSLPGEAPEREEVAEIMKQVERVSLITQNLLSFARKQKIQPENVQLNSLLEEILSQLGHQAPMTQIDIVKNLCATLPDLGGDKERLRQVFTNILLNAVQAMNGQGTLAVKSTFDEREVLVSIEDTGPGISADIMEKIFNPFFTTKSKGTGLGLSVSYGIVQAHSGSIEVSSATGQGAVFRIHLPLAKAFI